MIRTRIKICGIREGIHGLAAANAGADAIGLVFYKDSPRFVTPANAANIAAVLPPYITTVGLFVNATDRKVRDTLRSVRLDMLQFQGDEEPDFCASFGLPYVRAVRMEEGTDLLEWAGRFSSARALLLDAHVPGQRGGTGQTFDWDALPRNLAQPLILSGGLSAANVGEAIRRLKPWGVDVSSGVEAIGADGSTIRGTKDPARIAAFIEEVRNADG